MQLFRQYLNNVASLVNRPLSDNGYRLDPSWAGLVLDGEPNRILRSALPLSLLRKKGIFLTGRNFSTQLAAKIRIQSDAVDKFVDLTCGAGDLLIACAQDLPISRSLEQTLKNWSRRLWGTDLVPELVRATKLRIALVAITRGAQPDVTSPRIYELLSNIKVGNAFHSWEAGPRSVVLINHRPRRLICAFYVESSARRSPHRTPLRRRQTTGLCPHEGDVYRHIASKGALGESRSLVSAAVETGLKRA